jgi:uncharacterized protein (TIGR03435 family)
METRRPIILFILVVLIAIPLVSQSQSEAKPAFEVASIKPNKTGIGSAIGGSPTRFVATGVSLRFLIREAYRLRDFQIVGGPGWIDTDRWDVDGRTDEAAIVPATGLPDPRAPGSIELMLESLIEDRFQLKFHREVKELPVYELTVGRCLISHICCRNN